MSHTSLKVQTGSLGWGLYFILFCFFGGGSEEINPWLLRIGIKKKDRPFQVGVIEFGYF